MSNIIRIYVSTKLKLDELKENYSIKTFAELVEKMTSFIIDNNFDLNRNYTEDWHNVIEKSNDKTLKRIEDVIRIIRNIEKESVIPIRNQVYDMYHNNDANFKADVIDEVKKDLTYLKDLAAKIREVASDDDDFEIVNLAEDHISYYSKQLWFLKAMLV